MVNHFYVTYCRKHDDAAILLCFKNLISIRCEGNCCTYLFLLLILLLLLLLLQLLLVTLLAPKVLEIVSVKTRL